MRNNNPAIVVVAYNRPKSLTRLLKSIQNAYYPNKEVTLGISIDFSTVNNYVFEIAENFEWNYGEKKVIRHSEILGLKKHIISCGDLSQEYGSVIILEDDLYLSPNFFNYTISALNFSQDKDYIGGVALYNHKINVHKGEYFMALDDGFDNWYFQFACSWGQAWNATQWKRFKTWLSDNPTLVKATAIPENVSNWSDKSWLKFFIAYLINSNTYFLYPKVSLSTNFNDPGTHVGQDSTAYQVELLYDQKETYHFSTLDRSEAVYDAFFESQIVAKSLGYQNDMLEIDLYGYKPVNEKRFWLTAKRLQKKQLYAYTRSLKPIESNIIQQLHGNELLLYDMTVDEKNNFIKQGYADYRRIIYSAKVLSYKRATLVLKKLVSDRILKFLGKTN